MYLVDSNVWLEALLEQDQADEARLFFNGVEAQFLAISEFSIYSIGIAVMRLGKDELFGDFLSDSLQDSAITVIRLDPDDLKRIITVHQQVKMDFDDAYQYIAAEKHSLAIVTFDPDFDRTPLGRLTPAQALADYRQRHPPPPTP